MKTTVKSDITAEIALAKVNTTFNKSLLKHAKALGNNVDKKEFKNRIDLSSYALCTIDGETAKDFDDAVFAKRSSHKKDAIDVIVAIADVSHYVSEGSILDKEAFKRGTSIYYPGHCIPMLPEELSNGLCSLVPNENRLVIALFFTLSKDGNVLYTNLKKAIINSHARLTYNEVEDFFTIKDYKNDKITNELKDSLINLKKASTILRQIREERGAIDFDITESAVKLDDSGEPISINPIVRLYSHKMIEDLMVCANELVANYFFTKKIPSVYRVHLPPNEEKLAQFFKTAMALNALNKNKAPKNLAIKNPKDLQIVMSSFENSQYKEMLSTLLLRSMMQATYSEQNLMHFGLASGAYLHFTSPIRRYADLVVHRQLTNVLFSKPPKKPVPSKTLAQICAHISEQEMKATDLERKIDRLIAVSFMANKVGEVFDGIISSVTEFGLFVRLKTHHIEGLVHISAVSKNRIIFMADRLCLKEAGSNKTYSLGDKVKVKLVSVNKQRGFIDFEMLKDDIKKTKSKRKIK